MQPLPIGSLSQLSMVAHQIPAWNGSPNTSIRRHPLLIYRSVFTKDTTASQMENHLQAVGVVGPRWRYPMFKESHFHSTSHEVLCVSRGSAKLCFGHEDNPGRVVVDLSKGDVMIVPAGLSHRMLEDYGSFEQIGAYPYGSTWDMCYGGENEGDKTATISGLEWISRDPIYGDEGPTLSPEVANPQEDAT